MSNWANEQLRKIAETDDLHISPFREDGKTYGTPTWIWSVAVDDALYVRGYNGQKSRWYQAAVRQKQGRITAAGITKEVSANFAQPMKVEELAELVHMSVSSFHEHFRLVTSMSPLQYQKVLRLQEARRLMLSAMMDAGTASQRVGYLSASQFSREYSRFFGTAPTKDIARLRNDSRPWAEGARGEVSAFSSPD